MTVPRSAQTFTWLDKGTIHFHTYSIDVRDESFSRCHPWASEAPLTIPKEWFLTACYEKDVIWLWEQVTHIKYEVQGPILRIESAPSHIYRVAVAPILPAYTPPQTLVPYVDQPCENDGLWLLKEYLDKFYPKVVISAPEVKRSFLKGTPTLRDSYGKSPPLADRCFPGLHTLTSSFSIGS